MDISVSTNAGVVDAFLANAKASPATSTRYLISNEGHIAFDDSGVNGPLVIAMPGMGDLRHQYRRLRPYFDQAGLRLVTMDPRGQGESSISWGDFSAKAAAQDVLRLMDELGADQAFIAGNSYTAGAAAWAAFLAPKRIKGIILLGPIMRDIPVSPWLRALIRIGFMGPWKIQFWLAYWNSLFPSKKPADHKQFRESLKASLSKTGRMDVLYKMINLSKAETENIIGKVNVPSLVVMGTKRRLSM